uniref:Putative secreted protein n=1 Tax=Ixodes ricinus TaxID=34613 RepID=A0A6B0U3D4_IXORI
MLSSIHAWCKAVSPSTLVVLISAPLSSRRETSAVSPAAQAARNMHPSLNLIFCGLSGGRSALSWLVSESSQRFSCSFLLKSELLGRDSKDITRS